MVDSGGGGLNLILDNLLSMMSMIEYDGFIISIWFPIYTIIAFDYEIALAQ